MGDSEIQSNAIELKSRVCAILNGMAYAYNMVKKGPFVWYLELIWGKLITSEMRFAKIPHIQELDRCFSFTTHCLNGGSDIPSLAPS